jgi:hypothetical protein
MKRDMDLIRLLLLRSVGDEKAARLVEKYDVPERAHHVALLQQAGFVDAVVTCDEYGQPTRAIVRGLTWQGHEFLDAMRDDTVWKKAKNKMIKPGVSWTVSLLFEVLKAEAKKQLGLWADVGIS